eukprot:1175776-Prorocentrum_minimum.AAC.3
MVGSGWWVPDDGGFYVRSHHPLVNHRVVMFDFPSLGCSKKYLRVCMVRRLQIQASREREPRIEYAVRHTQFDSVEDASVQTADRRVTPSLDRILDSPTIEPLNRRC